jgi:hypothetical protein
VIVLTDHRNSSHLNAMRRASRADASARSPAFGACRDRARPPRCGPHLRRARANRPAWRCEPRRSAASHTTPASRSTVRSAAARCSPPSCRCQCGVIRPRKSAATSVPFSRPLSISALLPSPDRATVAQAPRAGPHGTPTRGNAPWWFCLSVFAPGWCGSPPAGADPGSCAIRRSPRRASSGPGSRSTAHCRAR